MRRISLHTARVGLSVLLFASLFDFTALAENRVERIVQNIPSVEKKRMEDLSALSQISLVQIAEATSPGQIEKLTHLILALDNPGIGSRSVDADERAAIHRYIQEQITKLAPHGVEYLGSLRGKVPAPVSVDRLVVNKEPTPAISINGHSWPVMPLWPNGAMPSLTPKNGLSGRLVYAGDGNWKDIEGLDLNGAIALMNFAGGRNWDRLFSLGCQAVVVVEDDRVLRERAERLFCNTPVPFPRFYVNKETGAELMSHAARKIYAADGNPALMAGEPCKLSGGNLYEQRPYESLFAWLPPSAPEEFTIGANELVIRIAGDFGVSPGEIIARNPFAAEGLKSGDELVIPNTDKKYVVKNGDLLERLAAQFSVARTDIAKVNNLGSEELHAGQTITIPNFADSLFVFVPIESESVVPDAPHGAIVAANIATALLALDHLATAPGIHRRKGIVFAFLDGDALGGVSSRSFAENLLLAGGKLASQTNEDAGGRIANYTAAGQWLAARVAARGKSQLSEEASHWFGEKWLATRLEKIRVAAAEQRIGLLDKQRTTPPGAAGDAVGAELGQLEQRIDRIAAFREATLDNRAEPWSRRVELFIDGLGSSDAPLPFTPAGLQQELDAELKEEMGRRANADNNLKVAQAIRGKVWQDRATDTPVLGWQLDLSDGSTTTGIKTDATFRFDTRFAGGLTEKLGSRLHNVLAFACARAGWADQFPFYAGEDASEFPTQAYEAVPYYPEFWATANIAVVPLGAMNDQLTLLDTPHDTPEHINFQNFSAQARHVLLIIKLGVESQLDSLPPPELAKQTFGRLAGKTVRFNVRSGIDPQEPVAQTWVYYAAVGRSSPQPPYNTATARGARRGVLVQSLLNGSYQMPVESINWNITEKNEVQAFHLDRETALFDKVVDRGQIGTQKQSPEFKLIEGQEIEKNLVLTEVYPLVFFPGADPMDYVTIGTDQQYIRVSDALLNGEPQHFSIVNPSVDYTESEVDSNTLYMPPGRRARMMVQKNVVFKMLLTGEITPETPKGEGYLVGPAADGGRNLSLPLTPLLIARDMQAQARQRQRIYQQFGIRDQAVNLALDSSGKKAGEAADAVAQKKWQLALGSARGAWGILIKFYPRILTLGRDAVFSVIILMALMVPGCAFLEKLLIGAKTILGHLAGAIGIFLAGTIFLRFFHPAFLISVSPFIVLIAFTMILMSVIVLVICYQRFEVLLRRTRSAGGETESEEISLVSSLGTAFSLGVSNLKKRMSRTLLTAFTVTVLTFSIVAFVSVKGHDVISFRPRALDRDVEGGMVQPFAPKYHGLLFRNFYWQKLSDQFVSALRTDFGSMFELTTRGHYLQVEGGNGADREGINQIPVSFGGKTHILTGIMAFEPNEVDFSGLNDAVSNRAWFRDSDPVKKRDADRFVIILPDNAAEALGITPAMIFDVGGKRLPDDRLPQVTMMNLPWRVIGILDVKHADRIRDISGKSLAMVDYTRSAFSKNVPGDLANENESFHMSWDKLAIIPMAAAPDVKADVRAVALKFNPNTDTEAFYNEIALRLNRTFFGTRGNELGLITTKQQVNLGGLAKIIVPVILCILIVTNTMMGAVEERKGEVGMLGAIGLSPRQISFLLLSESTVFSIIGIIGGVFCGLAFANLVPWIAARYGVLGSLSFNFTSVASMGLAMGTGAIVLLATLIPARRAAAFAAPSGMVNWKLPAPSADGVIRFHLPFTLTRGNAVGMVAFFRRFLLNHTEPTSSDFNCRNIHVHIQQGKEDALVIKADMWLAPYDLDVAQQLEMRMMPTENAGVFTVFIILQRSSGTEESWLRTNYGFLDLVRRQFLLWRHLDLGVRANYIKSGADLFQKGDATPSRDIDEKAITSIALTNTPKT